MPPYKSPERGSAFYAKFVRVDEALVVTDSNDTVTQHDALAKTEGIFDSLKQKMVRNEIDTIDAGYYFVYPEGKILVTDSSTTLDLPKTKTARSRSVEVFRRLSPGFTVSE